jgi:DNA-binding MarR family transcriptional regulator
MRKRDIARYIMDALPAGLGSEGTMPADHLALLLLLEGEGPLDVGQIGEALGRAQASASALIDRVEAKARVYRSRDTGDHRRTVVSIGVRAVREKERSRGSRRLVPYVKGPQRRITVFAPLGDLETLECGHGFRVTRTDRRGAKTRRCNQCMREGAR